MIYAEILEYAALALSRRALLLLLKCSRQKKKYPTLPSRNEKVVRNFRNSLVHEGHPCSVPYTIGIFPQKKNKKSQANVPRKNTPCIRGGGDR